MANFIKGAIVAQLPVSAEPRTAYFLGNGDGTFSFHMADDNGVVRAQRDSEGVISVSSSDTHVVVNNDDPKNPTLSLNLDGLKNSIVAGSDTLVAVNKGDGNTALEVKPQIANLIAGDNIELEKTEAGTTIKAQVVIPDLPVVLQGITEQKVAEWDAKLATETVTSLSLNSAEMNDDGRTFDVQLGYGNEEGVVTPVMFKVPVTAAYELPDHLESLTPEDVTYLKDLRANDNIGVWA